MKLQAMRHKTNWPLRVICVVMVASAAVLLAVLLPARVSALDVPPKPTDNPVVDQTNTLSAEQKQSLADAIAKERANSGNQIAILMVPSLQGDSLEEYSLKVARGWGIGQKERNSGVLLFIAKDDRKLRIEVGYGLEGALTDIRSGQIIRDRITPQFRQGKYYEGLREGLAGIIAAIHNEKDPNLKPEGEGQTKKGFKIPFDAIFWGIFVIPVWLGSILARTKSWWLGGVIGAVAGVVIAVIFGFILVGVISIAGLALLGLLLDWAVSRNYQKHVGRKEVPSWWAGGPWIGGGPNSDGGFGGFGGGSFGGGGSSGNW